ncbi:hypothetical protein Sfulv_51220 [Streptomyces fulvorobeus]|uniref:Uncharacterized protein n=1 Tax=Streptomyces fulvorobeus TaxID=284028 RepID=A0A7J0CCS0_9ACTN|nr:hypothetical protein Sfulv_51220 [Streptomyces fulvorobeus]
MVVRETAALAGAHAARTGPSSRTKEVSRVRPQLWKEMYPLPSRSFADLEYACTSERAPEGL